MVLSPVTRRRRLVAALAAVVLVLGLVVLAVVLRGGPATDPVAAPDRSASPSTAPSSGTPSPVTPSAPAPSPDPAAPDAGAQPAPEQPTPALGSADEVATALPSIEGDLGHLDPVEAGEIVQVGPGATVTLDALERVDPQVSGPGEVAGPAVQVTVTVTNGSTSPLTLDGAVVNLYGQGGTPGSVYSSDARGRPLAGVLDPGAQRSGTYVVSLPSTLDGVLVVSVSLGVGLPTPVFIATVPQES